MRKAAPMAGGGEIAKSQQQQNEAISTPPSPQDQASWRDTLPVHPAAELFPLLSPAELRELGEDIKKNGLANPIAICMDSPTETASVQLVDGRNRLDAMELVGIRVKVWWNKKSERWLLAADEIEAPPCHFVPDGEVFAYVISANIHRRHLTGEQKRELIARLIKAAPERSDRSIAEMVKVDHKTVGAARTDLEARGEIPHVETRTDTKGRRQPATRQRKSFSTITTSATDKIATKPEKAAFLLRASKVAELAVYSGVIDEEVVKAASAAAVAWRRLAATLQASSAARCRTLPTVCGARHEQHTPRRLRAAALCAPISFSEIGVMLDHSCQVQRHTLAERGLDLYETPAVAVEALLRVEELPHTTWECAAGNGAIVRPLRAAGHHVITSDIVSRDFPLDFVADFLTLKKAPPDCGSILTNPPFRNIGAFVENALRLCPHVVMLARLAFMESERRCNILESCGLARIHVFRKRLPIMHRAEGAGRKANSGMAFGWFIWDRAHTGPAVIDRISWDR